MQEVIDAECIKVCYSVTVCYSLLHSVTFCYSLLQFATVATKTTEHFKKPACVKDSILEMAKKHKKYPKKKKAIRANEMMQSCEITKQNFRACIFLTGLLCFSETNISRLWPLRWRNKLGLIFSPASFQLQNSDAHIDQPIIPEKGFSKM